MSVTVLENCSILTPGQAALNEDSHVVIEDNRIREVGSSGRVDGFANAHRIDVAGRTVMPGLIDAHVHVTVASLDIGQVGREPASLTALRARGLMHEMLMRGFTTVRDAGGADWGLARAVAEGLIPGPRPFYSGRALSQTGGHGDFRPLVQDGACLCSSLAADFNRIVDGVPEMQKAAREELRRGATQIKIMASGGVASPTDPVWNLQFSDEEIAAAVWEAKAWHTYVMAHAYTPEAVSRAVNLGVRSIEHGNLIDEPTATLMAAKGAYYVPTLVTYEALFQEGSALGFPKISIDKIGDVRGQGAVAVEATRAAGVQVGFGTDLLGPLHHHQSMEFLLRGELMSGPEVIQEATTINAALLEREGELGVVAAGALADLLVVDGDPGKDLGLLQEQGRHLDLIMRDGVVYKNALAG